MIVLITDVLQWLGCAFGIAGAYLVARNDERSKFGFVSFLISNGFWIAFGYHTHAWGLVTQTLAFTYTSGLGIYCWIIHPRKAQVK